MPTIILSNYKIVSSVLSPNHFQRRVWRCHIHYKSLRYKTDNTCEIIPMYIDECLWQFFLCPFQLNIQHDVDGDKIIVRILDKCDSPNSPSFLWSGIMFGWKGLLLVYGAFLAWESRQVKNNLIFAFFNKIHLVILQAYFNINNVQINVYKCMPSRPLSNQLQILQILLTTELGLDRYWWKGNHWLYMLSTTPSQW